MVSPTSRRALLAATVGSLGALTGCSTLSGERDSEPEPFRIGGIELTNRDTSPHSVDLLLLRDGDPVHWAEYDIQARDGARVYSRRLNASEFDGCTAGRWTIAVRLDTETRRTFAPDGAWAKSSDGSIQRVDIGERTDGGAAIGLSTSEDPQACETATGTAAEDT